MNAPRLFEIRIPQHLLRSLREAVAPRRDGERIAFGLASHAQTPDRDLLLVRKIVSLGDGDYVPTIAHGAEWRGRAMLPLLNEAIAGNLGVVMFHAHPHSGPVDLSGDDRASATRLLPVFQNLVPARPHASVVLGDECAAGMVADPLGLETFERVRVRWLGKTIRDYDAAPVKATVTDIYTTQALLTGSAGEAALRRAKVAVVGLSGGGSHVVQQFAHFGVEEIIGIDADRAEVSQRSRLIGLSPADARRRLRKTRVMADLVRRINPDVRFTPIPYSVPEQPAIDALKRSDIIVGGLDNYHARAEIMALAWRFMIPYVDIGLLIRPGARTKRIEIGGDVVVFIPGGFCAWCIGRLSKEKLDLETGGRPKSYFQGAEKQAQVVSMNGLLASQAATEVLALLTGFRDDHDDPEMAIRKFDGIEGTLVKWIVKKKATCDLCEGTLGGGDPVWTPA
jgi:molybdopterin/thiamine biosynthesis adenylyltransferase